MNKEDTSPSLSESLGIGERAKVLLLGTFHFGYPNLDVFSPEEKVDMLSHRSRAEAEEVVERLAAFRPTKVAVEARSEHEVRVNEEYHAYRAGRLELRADEGHQIAFPVAALMGHDRLYAIDEWGQPYLSEGELLAYARKRLGDAAGTLSEMELWYGLHEKSFPEYGKRLTAYADRMLAKKTLREHLLLLNSEEYCRLSHGPYLTWADQSPGDYTMPDHISGWWYDRNLRIFANLKRITESPEDRILVIFGAGHVPILRHAIACSPMHELADLGVYLA